MITHVRHPAGSLLRRSAAVLLIATLSVLFAGCSREPYQASYAAAAVDQQIDWHQARLLAVQDAGRCKSLESFARESFATITGREHLPGLSPLASLLEWLFHLEAYVDTPIVKVGSQGLRVRLADQLSEDKRQRFLNDKRLTLRELFESGIEAVLTELERQPRKGRAVGRVRNAQTLAVQLGAFLTIVPQPGGDDVAPWHTPDNVLGTLTDAQLAQLGFSRSALPAEARQPIINLDPDTALELTVTWASLRAGWLAHDAASVQKYLDRLCDLLPTLAETGVYPAPSQLSAEARYYSLHKLTFGWVVYFLAFLFSIWALATGLRTARFITTALLLVGLALHAYGLGLRWYILDRIPVANMFEAVVASAWIGIIIALIVDWYRRTPVLLTAASVTGFSALLAGAYVLPGSELGTIPAILDDIQLRIHTVLIIASYALIFLAAVVAACYLLGFYLRPAAASAGVSTAAAGGNVAINAGGNEPDLPRWLNDIDASHMTIVNLVFVLLFLGTITGAWWADYSWGRPWGWDPKEVFALNTWLVYAVLVHVRFVVRRRGLWTAWLSLLGCTMMAFNWFFVNFFIASVHSYV